MTGIGIGIGTEIGTGIRAGTLSETVAAKGRETECEMVPVAEVGLREMNIEVDDEDDEGVGTLLIMGGGTIGEK